MRSCISCTSLFVALASCINLKPTPIETGTDPTTAAGVVVLDTSGTLYGDLTARMGSALVFLDDGRLLIGAPSFTHGEVGDQIDDLCWLTEHRDGFVSIGIDDEVGALQLDDTWGDLPYWPAPMNRFGLEVLSLGDVTGDGIADIVIGDEPHDSLFKLYWAVFPGPDYAAGFPLPWQLGAGRADSCGDLSGDGIAELCTADGVFYGPLTEETRYGLSWTAQDPHITAADLDNDSVSELFISDSATSTIHHLVAPSADGEVTLSTVAIETWTAINGMATALATGDLDGDGADELIAGWIGVGDVTLVGLPSGGGDVFSARTALPVRADELAVGDFDGDGQDDLAVGGASEVTIWLGPLSRGTLDLSAAAARYRGPQYPSDDFGSALAAADTDGDGQSELAIGATLDNSSGESCETQGTGTCVAAGRVWWLSGGGF